MSARPLLLLLLLAFLTLPGCAKPRNVVQLMPDPDGHVGQVVVTNQAGSSQLVQAGTAVRVADAKSAPTAPEALSTEESEALFGAARRALPEKPVRFILYFDSETTRLTPESQALVPKVLATAKERDSHDIAVVGHASAAGDANYNIEISRKRAESVRKLLVKAGLTPEGIEVASHGSANPLVVSGNPHEPRNRRVEITVR
jgi:outer membrane protein OmpA-like peptidoglycan-associated protein